MSDKENISIGKYRHHPPKKKHPYLIRMILYLIVAISIGVYAIHFINTKTSQHAAENPIKTDQNEIEIELE